MSDRGILFDKRHLYAEATFGEARHNLRCLLTSAVNVDDRAGAGVHFQPAFDCLC